jgi:two-component system chemotaxis sensor kinase CheA
MSEDDYNRLLKTVAERGDLLKEGFIIKTKKGRKRGKMQSISGNPVETVRTPLNRQSVEAMSSIRVRSNKLDKLVDLVGEMVTLQARLSQAVSQRADPELLMISEEVERLTEELRENTMSIRMVPMGTTFGRYQRLVRDLSKELGKEVQLITEGGETELDKSVIEKLNDPLVHIIRNSIDHGIESPDERKASGKPARGNLRLSASHEGAFVIIKVEDDGSGLDPEAIRQRAVERGLLLDKTELSEKDVLSLIFQPGFSTSNVITDVSGRGVGLDVVKRNVEALRGMVEIENTNGNGTTIVLKLPLTLAIIEGLLVSVSEWLFVIPLPSVQECIELTREESKKANGKHLVNVRGNLVPYIRLREQFSVTGEPPAIEQIVITGHDNNRVGFVVDHVVGEHQTVIKSLGKLYQNITRISKGYPTPRYSATGQWPLSWT